jgi:hypothetical protein
MSAIQFNLHVEAGATFERSLIYTNDDGSLFDLEGYTAELQVRLTATSSTAVITLEPEIDVETATISWEFTATQTSLLTASSYVYAIELTNEDDYVIRLMEGYVIPSPEVVR